jgi:hypothetical protein
MVSLFGRTGCCSLEAWNGEFRDSLVLAALFVVVPLKISNEFCVVIYIFRLSLP